MLNIPLKYTCTCVCVMEYNKNSNCIFFDTGFEKRRGVERYTVYYETCAPYFLTNYLSQKLCTKIFY